MDEINIIYQELEVRKKHLEPIIEKLDKKIRIYTRWAWSFVIVGFAVTLLGIFLFSFCCLKLNELGDYFSGTVASSWSLAGLFFIYVAFLGQKQQLVYQQIELTHSQVEVKATRYELQGQKEQLIEQNKTAKLQRFENTFFSLLANYTSLVNNIDIRKKETVLAQGHASFETFYRRFIEYCQDTARESGVLMDELSFAKTLNSYMYFFDQNHNHLGHYFRNLYHILKLIKQESALEDKKRYSNLIRAQLSSFELVLLFYNCLSDYGKEKFYPLIEEFDFLKHIDVDLLINKDHLNEYPTLITKHNIV